MTGNEHCAILLHGAMTYSVWRSSNSSSDCVYLQVAGIWKQLKQFIWLSVMRRYKYGIA